MINDKSSDDQDEQELDPLATALSYVCLYAQEDTTHAPSPPPPPDADTVVWRDDAWTDQDEERAAQLLDQHQDRCTTRKRQLGANDDGDAWNHFYQNHGVSFFHDRHYLAKAFPVEFSPMYARRTLVEVGCGVGNNILPLLEHSTSEEWKTVWGLDFSDVAIDLLRRDSRFQKESHRAHAQVWDISLAPLDEKPPWFGVADVTTLLFCLSALHPDKMELAAQNVIHTLKPGGTLLFRDYGRYDEAQLKLGTSRGKRLGDNYYRKHDSTTCYYFTLEDLERLFGTCLEILELQYIRRVYHNRAQQEERRRVWVQGRFRKPINS